MTETAREQIAEIIRQGNSHCALDGTDCADTTVCEDCYAGRILAIPEIKEGQKLRERVKSGKLVELADTQVKPALRADQLSSMNAGLVSGNVLAVGLSKASRCCVIVAANRSDSLTHLTNEYATTVRQQRLRGDRGSG
ncbi:hypothetical protein LCGC14_1362750 [marine sediment metagenome]|uniref:Uncharacterized protein n=1 Tax=marine sediment metagenome TaxID=412755 RepID=A0A0F9K877_9ZZZZ